MSTFTGLTTMVRGIFNAQTALNTTGHNITNAATPGYSRQSANPTATGAEHRGGIYGAVEVGTGVEVQSITRSRDIFADKQFRNGTSTMKYYETRAKAYDNLEVIFNDSQDTGMADAVGAFYKSWVDLSTMASSPANRQATISKAQVLCDTMQTYTEELQKQINTTYSDIELYLTDFNQVLQDIVDTNKMIIAAEADGSTANDLRDNRDLLVDKLSEYVNVSVSENEFGAFQINSGGITLVTGIDRLHFAFSSGVGSEAYGTDYGITDHNIYIKESDQIFVPQNGMFKADFDIIDECKSYIDKIANMATFMLTTFNDQHKAGYDANGDEGENFFGDATVEYNYSYDTETRVYGVTTLNSKGEIIDTTTKNVVPESNYTQMTGVQIIKACKVNANLTKEAGYNKVAAATQYAVKDSNGDFIDYSKLSTGDLNSEYKLTWGATANSETSVYGYNTVGIADGTNAVYISELFNMSYETVVETGRSNAVVMNHTMDYIRSKYGDSTKYANLFNSLAGASFNDFYSNEMTVLAIDARAMDSNVEQQEKIMVQIQNWRDSTSGVDWNEELTNMIKFQKAYSSCARCLTAMDECLEKLLGTGLVGR